jgi:hypothetical protein
VGDWYEASDGWYEAAEAAEEEADVVYHREMAKLNAAIEECLAELTHESREHEAFLRAGRRCLGDLIGCKNEIIAHEATRRLLQMPSPDRRAHEAGVDVELGRQERQLRQQRNKESRDASLVRLESRYAVERAAAHERELSGKRTITPEEAERTRALATRTDRRRAAAEERHRRATQLVRWSGILTYRGHRRRVKSRAAAASPG